MSLWINVDDRGMLVVISVNMNLYLVVVFMIFGLVYEVLDSLVRCLEMYYGNFVLEKDC